MLELLEWRHDWAAFVMTMELMKYVFKNLIPDVIFHSAGQDEEQVTDHYDRGDDFHEWFLGPRMIYTSGIISDADKKETLEQLQDNKLAVVCQKLRLQPEDTLLDIGCGWGTLVTYAAKNFGCDATGVTLSHNQAEFGTNRIAQNGVDPTRARILRTDFRNLDKSKKFTKIVSLEMAEHVGIRRYNTFLRDVYNLLDDDGILVFQVAGIRPSWQYEDLIWYAPLPPAPFFFFTRHPRLLTSRKCHQGLVHEQVRLPRRRRLVRAQLGHRSPRGRRFRSPQLRRARRSL